MKHKIFMFYVCRSCRSSVYNCSCDKFVPMTVREVGELREFWIEKHTLKVRRKIPPSGEYFHVREVVELTKDEI